MRLADRLRERRNSLGLSMAAAARELGVATSNYRMWELGYAKPDSAKWHPISHWLDLPFPTFLRGEGLLTAEEERAALAINDTISPRVAAPEMASMQREETHRLFEHAEILVRNLADQGIVSAEEASTALLHIGQIKEAVREADFAAPSRRVVAGANEGGATTGPPRGHRRRSSATSPSDRGRAGTHVHRSRSGGRGA